MNDDDLALVGEESLTSHDVGSSEPHQLTPAGAARKKILPVNDMDNGGSRRMALVGEESLTSHDVGSSEPHPLMPAGAARKKNLNNLDFDGDNPLSPAVERLSRKVLSTRTTTITGRVTEVVGTLVKALIPNARVGEVCELRDPRGRLLGEGEVVGFADTAAILSVYGELLGLSAQTLVVPTGRSQDVPVSDALLGRVFDGMGRPLDGKPMIDIENAARMPLYRAAPDPLARRLIKDPLPLGIRCLDGMLTCGEGQRLGIFAAAGVGKSVLLSSMVLGASVDVTVIALIGERGREVREFIEHNLGEQGLARSVLVIATSDRSSMERARAAWVATTMAEYFREQGKRVLLLMDSVTRFARAIREIGLAAGEPPTRRGFPPSVFATLPRLMERSGMGARGSITAFYTVLVEGDDMTEPVADETRSILDGHIILSRELAAGGHYPAVDVLRSASRVMGSVTSAAHQEAARRWRELLAAYEGAELLIRIGEYSAGSDAVTDEAIARRVEMLEFLRQGMREFTDFGDVVDRLCGVAGVAPDL
ncbi:MAG: type III secretion system ATPase SctN [Alphaproteobacteria bacterium]|nr:type III secretion system ATPase SctN [Alphaproteobacteria bacterium]MDA8004535.1 type III secretion system ATPase SctN [Alphaproteobacteria bacterium]MDA8006386.1 type III secretion system ATPase SctN [Alphaproteobacteria bacterium]MDA8013784.1 type III secretion system ATPase SctN [Alphaproteobacteria bacterium]